MTCLKSPKSSECLFHNIIANIQLVFKNREKKKKKSLRLVLRLRNTCAIECAKITAKNTLKQVLMYVHYRWTKTDQNSK